MIRYKKGSLFLKLFMIFGLTFLAIAIAISIPKWGEQTQRKLFTQNIQVYAQLLAKEIGDPPDKEIAEEVHRRTGLIIFVEGPSRIFQVPPKAEMNESHFFLRKHRFVLVNYGDYKYQFKSPHLASGFADDIGVVLGAILLILLLSYWWVRKTFRPLDEIGRVAEEVSKGNFSAKISQEGKGELTRLSNAINDMTQQLENRFENLRQLLRAVSHEVRTPLTSMRIAIESVDNEKTKKSLVEDIKQLDDLTFNLLEQERLRSSTGILNIERQNISDLTVEVLKAFTDSNIEADIDEKIVMPVDKARYILVVRNLLKNAILHGKGEQVKLSLTAGKSGFTLAVQDNGPGMPVALIKRVGEAFLRADESRDRRSGGVGLGLSLVHSVVKAHKAEMFIENTYPGLFIKIEFNEKSLNSIPS